jgi:hypothetical protein
MSDSKGFCKNCKKVHDWAHDDAEHLNCVPPLNVLRFGDHVIPREYRDALHAFSKSITICNRFYNTEEVVGSFLGHNPHFPSCAEWGDQQVQNRLMSDSDDE